MENENDLKQDYPISSLTEIDELDFEDDVVQEIVGHDIPLYEKALQDLFGKETSDRYLHPKINESIGVAGMSASLKSHRIMGVVDRKRYKRDAELSLGKIQGNAERLWLMLRENSNYNIQRVDKKIDPGLKGSFNAFARGFIGRNMTPPQRGFAEDNELVEMRRKMKSDKLAKVELHNRKKHLMFDLSELQEGNQAMLFREKSIINIAQPGIKELLFPPITEAIAAPREEEKITRTKKSYREILSDMDVEIVNEEALFQDRPTEALNLRFFSEADSLRTLKEDTAFRSKIQNMMVREGGPVEQVVRKSRRRVEEDGTRYFEGEKDLGRSKAVYGLGAARSDIVDGYQGKIWPPLTLGAVMDFKITRIPTFVNEEEAQFRQGACRLWRPKLALA